MTNKNNYFDTTTIILLGLLVLLLVFSIPLFMNNSKINNITRDLDIIETFKSDSNQNKSASNQNENDKKLELYTMDGCGHCVNFKTTWGKISTHPELGKFAVEIGPSSPEYEKLCSKHNIRGFPHIQITKNGMKITEYKGPRTVYDIYNWFINTVT